MRAVCAWCRVDQGERPGPVDMISHVICPSCAGREVEKLEQQYENEAALKAARKVPLDAECQEASPQSNSTYIACGARATSLVDNGDRQPYWMCDHCTAHNVTNRGAKVLATLTEDERRHPIDLRD